ncbi:MAG TPA: C10 family peptidase, partial [Bacteroidia bacterium]|nr:C10 family peptidase [Bacteroidia bacterium]
TASTMSVTPLVKTTWDQSPYYNAMCPGTGNNKAVTGCVATAMAQIMRFWNYPAHGTGSSSYCDCTSGGFSVQNGTLTANYGATTYSWTAMPLNVTSTNNAVATLMYQCGVSVDMDYSPSGSGAYVIASDNAICAQTSYTNYFSYDPTTIQGLSKSNYADAAWTTLLINELNIGRPLQYAGDDASQGGHTWVCDGYDVSNNFHMNWGWSGQDNGYFTLTNLTTTGGFNPIQNQQALIGIKPMATYSVDAGISSVVSPSGNACTSTFIPVVTLKNFGANTLTSCTINYNVDNGANNTYNWTGSLANGLTTNVTLPSITTTAGSHTLTSSTSNPNASTDGNTTNDQSTNTFVSNTSAAVLPLVEGFESSGTNLPAGWTLGNPDNDAAWQIVTTVAHTGTNCIGFNNFDGDQTTDMTGRKDWFYTGTYNFSSSISASMTFDVAYAVLNYSGTLYTDTLSVLYSVDCGTTWHQIYKKGGATLASAGTTTNTSTGWTPASSSQWRTDNINLSAITGQASVMFAFQNTSDWADWLYIDNINITANSTTGISSNNALSSVSVYPNPAHNNISVTLLENTRSVSVTDIIGQTVIAEQKVEGAQQVQTIDITNLASGVYFMKINSTDSQTKIIRFIKE